MSSSKASIHEREYRAFLNGNSNRKAALGEYLQFGICPDSQGWAVPRCSLLKRVVSRTPLVEICTNRIFSTFALTPKAKRGFVNVKRIDAEFILEIYVHCPKG